MTQNDGGPAFPRVPFDVNDYTGDGSQGMALRDWFAGHCFSQAVEDYGQPGLGDNSKQRKDRGNPVLPYATAEMSRETIIAAQAYRYADAMLAERSRK